MFSFGYFLPFIVIIMFFLVSISSNKVKFVAEALPPVLT